jgi:NifU-like protein involved in Fe-S cluster formation
VANHKGTITNPSGTGRAENAATGETITIYIKVEGERITDAQFETTGCGVSEAAAEEICRKAVGMHIDEASEITQDDVEDALAAKNLGGSYCAHLAANALYFAIINYVLSPNS